MSESEFVRQREYDRFVKTTDDDVADLRDGQQQLRKDLGELAKQHARDMERLPDQLDKDVETAVAAAVGAAVGAAVDKLAAKRTASVGQRIAAIAAGAGVVAAWAAVVDLIYVLVSR